ncbi:ribosomal RNA small subunit methyltransferase G [Clostridia bacterium]|nr:ribosomal RNA small subunit methyltransferase G [Clostridia bacterium]
MFLEELTAGCAAMGINLPSGAAERFALYDSLLRDENRRQNLTRDLDAPDYVQRLYLDSLTPLMVPLFGKRAVDIGSGAGFPGVPLAIVREDIEFTLLDSLEKRCQFLRRVVAELGLNAEVVHTRAEDFGRDRRNRGRFDLAFSRAVASLPVLMELTVPLLRLGGSLIAHKGPAVVDEYQAARNAAVILRASLDDPIPAGIQGTESRHVLVVAHAVKPCPIQYPRKAGTPTREPLG